VPELRCGSIVIEPAIFLQANDLRHPLRPVVEVPLPLRAPNRAI